MSDYKKILAALDFSDPSYAAAQEALELAARLSAEVTFCHVIDARYMDIAASTLVEPPALQEERLRKVAQERMDELLGRVGAGVEIRVSLRIGVPCDEILAEREEWGADLVIMGTHGRTGLKRAILGSQAELVMRGCPVPIMIVHERPKDEPVACNGDAGAKQA